MVIMTDTTTISNAVRSIFVAVSTDSGHLDERDGQRAYLGFARSVGLVYLLEADMVCSNAGVPLCTRQPNGRRPQLQELYLATAAGATFADCQLDMRQHSRDQPHLVLG
jgi:hypothetical protein